MWSEFMLHESISITSRLTVAHSEYRCLQLLGKLLIHSTVVCVIAPTVGFAVLFTIWPPALGDGWATPPPLALRFPVGLVGGVLLLPFSLHWTIPASLITCVVNCGLGHTSFNRIVWIGWGSLAGLSAGCFATFHYSLPIPLASVATIGGIIGVGMGLAWRRVWEEPAPFVPKEKNRKTVGP